MLILKPNLSFRRTEVSCYVVSGLDQARRRAPPPALQPRRRAPTSVTAFCATGLASLRRQARAAASRVAKERATTSSYLRGPGTSCGAGTASEAGHQPLRRHRRRETCPSRIDFLFTKISHRPTSQQPHILLDLLTSLPLPLPLQNRFLFFLIGAPRKATWTSIATTPSQP